MSKYRGVIVGYNTLADAVEPTIAQQIFVAAQEFGLTLSRQNILDYWDRSPVEAYSGLFQTDRHWRQICRIFNEYSQRFPRRLYDDALPALDAFFMGGVATSIVTQTPREVAAAEMARNGVPLERLCSIQFGDEAAEPDPAGSHLLDRALQKLQEQGVEKRQVVVISDSLGDWRAAEATGLDFIGVSRGLVSTGEFVSSGVARAVSRIGETVPLVLPGSEPILVSAP